MSKKEREKSSKIKKNIREKESFSKLIKAKISLKKINPVVQIIRGLNVNKAKNKLIVQQKKSKYMLIKLIDSAIDNAIKKGYDIKKLFIKTIYVTSAGIKYKMITRSQGRANRIRRRYSNIYIFLGVI